MSSPDRAPSFGMALVVATVAGLAVWLTLVLGCEVADDFVLLRDACDGDALMLGIAAGAGCALIGFAAVILSRRR